MTSSAEHDTDTPDTAAPEADAPDEATSPPEHDGADDGHAPRGEVEPAELVDGGPTEAAPARTEAVEQPSKIMRIGTMIKQLLEEVRTTELDDAARDRLREIYETSVQELASTMSDDLREELDRLTSPFASDETPSGAELRLAQAQLVGWLEGLFQGIQATMFAQQMAAQQQLSSMRGQLPPRRQGGGGESNANARPGTYL
ncbi:MAG: proteasome activator [Actinomycetota bacterium]|nr:proteasome activator [Actinomycetota bacterium]